MGALTRHVACTSFARLLNLVRRAAVSLPLLAVSPAGGLMPASQHPVLPAPPAPLILLPVTY